MATFDWRPLLERWSQEILRDDPIYRQTLPDDVVSTGWLGYPGATEQEIEEAEARLGTRFPPSYRTFLSVTNGWRRTAHRMERLWSTEELEWFPVRHQEWIDIWIEESEGLPFITDEQYFVYGPRQDSVSMRTEYLPSLLDISPLGDYGSAIYLLNPQVVTSEGEWEAWFMATWLPGARRFRSFWEMMQGEYQPFLDLRRP